MCFSESLIQPRSWTLSRITYVLIVGTVLDVAICVCVTGVNLSLSWAQSEKNENK